MNDFKNEGVVASSAWKYQVNALRAEGQPIASVVPKEGATGWADTTMLHAEAKHPNCAYAWMNWSLEPKLQGDLAAWFGSNPAVPAACKGNALLTDEGCRPTVLTVPNRSSSGKPRRPKAASTCLTARWTQDYIAIMGGR